MEEIIEESLSKYVDDPEALEILKQPALELAAHRKNSDYYNYEFLWLSYLNHHLKSLHLGKRR